MCQGITKHGNPCKRPQEPYCHQHESKESTNESKESPFEVAVHRVLHGQPQSMYKVHNISDSWLEIVKRFTTTNSFDRVWGGTCWRVHKEDSYVLKLHSPLLGRQSCLRDLNGLMELSQQHPESVASSVVFRTKDGQLAMIQEKLDTLVTDWRLNDFQKELKSMGVIFEAYRSKNGDFKLVDTENYDGPLDNPHCCLYNSN